jgi:HSP20 family protein
VRRLGTAIASARDPMAEPIQPNLYRWKNGLRARVLAFGKTKDATPGIVTEPMPPSPTVGRRPSSVVRELVARARRVLGRDRWSPRIDVREDESALRVFADVPGARRDELSIRVVGKRLVITGRRDAEPPAIGDRVRTRERGFGAFTRKFALPDRADIERITSELRDGVLTISVAKKPDVREIDIASQAP